MRATTEQEDQEVLDFAKRAAAAFAENPKWTTFSSGDSPSCGDLFALRWGLGEDCVLVIRVDESFLPVLFQQIIARKQDRALDAAPAPEPAPATHPGWVFVDRDGDVWGWRPPTPGHPNYCRDTARAHRPFLTREEAEKQGARTSFGCVEVREWRPTDSVPPMPTNEPRK